MKQLLILLMAFSLVTACNNEKSARSDRESGTNSRDKDDYRNDEDKDKDKDKTSDRDEDEREDDRNNDRDNDDRKTSSGWSAADVNEFVSNCVNSAVEKGMARTAATNYCECMQLGLERKYPNSADVGGIDIESPSIKRMIEDCQNQ